MLERRRGKFVLISCSLDLHLIHCVLSTVERKLILEEKKKKQQHEAEEKLRQEQANQNPPDVIPEPVTNGDVTRSRRQRHGQLKRVSTPDATPTIAVNGDAFSAHNDFKSSATESLPRRKETTELPPKIEQEPSSDVMTSNQRLQMDMLYLNQAVASKQTESDDGSDDTVSTENETPDSTVSVKAMAEKLRKASVVGCVEPPTAEKPTSISLSKPEPEPTIVKKDSDLMWEKLMAQSFRVC